MRKYSFDFSDIDKLREYYRSQLDPNGTSDKIQFPNEIAEGYLSYYKISPEVFLLINNYTANTDIEYIREPIKEKDLILHFRKYALDHEIENDQINSTYVQGYTPGNMRCMHSQHGERVFIPKGAEVRSTMIVLKNSFLTPYFVKNKDMVEKVNTYIHHTHKYMNKFYLSYKQSHLFDQIVDAKYDDIENSLYFISRGILLLETFWQDVLRWDSDSNPFYINHNQVGNIYKVSNYLEKHLHEPFIGVDQLAVMAHMSRTNFFNMFKEIHNQTPLEFFNNKRLESSYSMIFGEGLSVKEVMLNLNYSNSSKFKKAFFNRFDVYPNVDV